MDLTVERQTVARGLGILDKAIERLVEVLAHKPVWISLQETPREALAISRACAAFSAIDYGMTDEVNTSVVCLGVLGVSADIIRRAEAVNSAKHAFKEICSPLQHRRIRIPVKGSDGPTKAIPAIRVILRNIQRSDLNLLAAYRKIPILAAPPATITYTRAHTRAVYRKSLDEVHELLSNLDSPAAAEDRARLTTLGRRDSHLALVRHRYQNIRANILYARLDPRGRGRVQVAAELPLLYRIGRRDAAPIVTFPTEPDATSNEPRRIRESKLEPQPFLRSLPVYRYAQPSPSPNP